MGIDQPRRELDHGEFLHRPWALPSVLILMQFQVGDSIDDMTAGHTAGAATVLLVNERNAHLQEHAHTDLCISRLDELVDILERGFVGTRENNEHLP